MAADLKQQFQALQEQKRQKLVRRTELNRKNAAKEVSCNEEANSKKNGLALSMFDEIDDNLNLMVRCC